MCDAIYIGKTQQTFNKIMDGHFSDLQRLLKNGQKSDSFSAHFCTKWAKKESDLCPFLSRRCRSEK